MNWTRWSSVFSWKICQTTTTFFFWFSFLGTSFWAPITFERFHFVAYSVELMTIFFHINYLPSTPIPGNLKESLDMQILFLIFVVAKFHPNPCQFSAWWEVSEERKPEHSKFWEPLYLTVYFKIWTCSLKRTPKTKMPKIYCELFHQYCGFVWAVKGWWMKVLLGNVTQYDFEVLGTWTSFMLQMIHCVLDSSFLATCFIILFGPFKICIFRIFESYLMARQGCTIYLQENSYICTQIMKNLKSLLQILLHSVIIVWHILSIGATVNCYLLLPL